MKTISGNNGAVLTFDVTATDNIEGYIDVNRIELVTPACQALTPSGFAIPVNSSSSVDNLYEGKAVSIYANGKDIIVESPVHQVVSIIDLAGRMRRVDVAAGRNVIAGNMSGVYIVVAAGKASKLILK